MRFTKEPLVSVIIPAYNCERFLDRCIAGCLNQTYRNIEVIAVDDGSDDSTYALLQKYRENDQRVIPLHQENAGVSAARNLGIQNAKGEYIIFLDCDDWLDEDAVSVLLGFAKRYPKHLIITDVKRVKEENGKTKENGDAKESGEKEKTGFVVLSAESALLSLGTEKYKIKNCHGNMYQTEMIRENSIFFNPDIYYGEDGLFNFIYLQYARGCVYTDKKPVWNVLVRSGSVTRNGYDKKKLTAIDAVDKMEKMVSSGVLKRCVRDYYINRAIGVLVSAVKDNCQKEDAFYIINLLKKKKHFSSNMLKHLKRYLFFYAVKIFPKSFIYDSLLIYLRKREKVCSKTIIKS